MVALAPVLLTLLLKAPSPSPSPIPSPSPLPSDKGLVILFLIDNSASLPPLDPDEKRVAALERMFTFLQGRPYRLVLFGGRRELFVDDPSRYRNNGQWTDFYSPSPGRATSCSPTRRARTSASSCSPTPSSIPIRPTGRTRAFPRGRT